MMAKDKATFPDWLRVDPKKFKLHKVDPSLAETPKGAKLNRADAVDLFEENVVALQRLQHVLFAEARHGVLMALQALDAGGKDGAIRHVLGPLNPQGVKVVSFRQPTARERAHDFLWRVHQHAPSRGMMVCFNRSHYEEVLVVRVHELVPKSVWRGRYEQINGFERLLASEGAVIVKFMLCISKDEQKERMQARLDKPHKNWKFSSSDVEERKHWDEYQVAFADMLRKTSTPYAPWYVIPANKKWFRNYAISTILRQTMESLDMHFPPPEPGLEDVIID